MSKRKPYTKFEKEYSQYSDLLTSIPAPKFREGSLKTEYEGDRFLNAYEAAEFLSVPYNSLLNMTSSGKIKYYKLGRRNRYLLSDLKALLMANQKGL